MYMQIVLQRVDGTDKETFPLIKMLKFLSERKSISCGTGHYLLPKRGGSGCLERFAFPSAYIIKKTNNLQISHKAGECRRKKSAKEQVSTFIYFFPEQGLCNVPSNSPSFLFKVQTSIFFRWK